jgi:hypothetical protein
MRKILRTMMIGVLVVAMSMDTASAWHVFGGGCGGYGGYRGSCGGYGYGGYGGYYGHMHYASSCYGSGYCGSYGYGGWGYSDSCGGGCSDGCSSYGDCGTSGGCGSYGGCDSCGGEVIDYGVSEPTYETAPIMPGEPAPSTTMPTPQQPTTTDRPMDTTPPQLPPEPAPGTTTPPQDQPPAPAEDTGDLFGEPMEPAETTTPTDATPPAEADDTGGLFGEPSTETTPPADTSLPPADTSTPAAEPTTEEPAADDLFGAPTDDGTTPGAGTTPPAEETPAVDETTEDAGDLFGAAHSILREPGGLDSAELRMWLDNTGKYSCHGRLVRFLDGKVRLLKDNGRTTTVPLYRLSAADLEFVHRQANAQQTETFGQLAQSLTMLPLLAD